MRAEFAGLATACVLFGMMQGLPAAAQANVNQEQGAWQAVSSLPAAPDLPPAPDLAPAPDLPPAPEGSPTPEQPSQSYNRPTERTLMHGLFLDSIGPYPIFMAVATAGLHQATDNPPEWHEGAAGFSKRFGSNMGITLVGNATRFGLASALHEETLYHRCHCGGTWVRTRHAVLSALTAHRLEDGKAVFSIPDLAAPYAATMTAVYTWYPDRYGAKDAFRMGNYNLLGSVGSNLTFEFLPKKVWDMLARVHLNSGRLASD